MIHMKQWRWLAALGLVAGVTAVMAPTNAFALTTVGAVSVIPNTPGVAAQYTVTFTTTLPLTANADTITLTFSTVSNTSGATSGVTLPPTISRTMVNIAGTQSGAGGVLSSQPPIVDPPVNVQAGTVTLTVPDMAPGGIAANHNLAAGSVTVIFSALANILNPAKAGTSYRIKVATSQELAGANVDVEKFTVPRVLTLSAPSGVRNSKLTVNGAGFTNGTTATVWLDANGNGVLDAGETTLASASISGNQFTATFSIGSAFVAGANIIQAIDGLGGTVPVASAPKYMVSLGTVYTTPTSGPNGSSVTVILQDFPPGSPVTSATIGGVAMTVPAGTMASVAPDGTMTFTTTVPAGVPPGVQILLVTVGGSLGSGVFTVTRANITTTPSTVVANQAVTVSGNGFTPSTAAGGAGPNGVHQITGVGASVLSFDGTAVAGVTYPINLDSGGNLLGQITLPKTGSVATKGQYYITVTDDAGRSGSATVTVAGPTLSLAPATSQIGTTVTARGGGFAANSTLTITYGATMVTTASTDSTGAYSATFTVPVTAGIPSTNTVTAASGIGAIGVMATHSVPQPALSLDQTSSYPGGMVKVVGTSFPAYTKVSVITVGGISVLPLPAPSTDQTGSFTAAVLVPQLPAGTTPVAATVGGSTGSASLMIGAGPTQGAAGAVLAALTNTGNLELVSSFDYGTALYQAYVPALAGNPLATVTPNSVLIITVTKDTTVVVSGVSFKLRAGTPTPVPVGASVTIAVQ